MVDRVMFGWLMRAALQSVTDTPCLIGWSPVMRGYQYLLSRFSGPTRGLDKTAWDWTVRGWMIQLTRDVIKELALCAPRWWLEWVDVRWEVLFRDAVFQFSDGEKVAQPGWGVMKSGCYLTILVNSIGQMLYHALAMRSIGLNPTEVPFVTIGDDVTLEDFPEFEAYERYILTHGALLKESVPTEHIEFAGFVTEPGRCWPEYWQKHAFAVCHTVAEKLPELITGYRLLYAHEDRMEQWLTWVLSDVSPASVRMRRANLMVWEAGCGRSALR
nr:hypothetical protein 2 [Amygdalus persica sobemo-like virus]